MESLNGLNALIPYIEVENRIATIRKQDVIADADVAELYGVETRRVNEAVRNNPDKFPEDYMFELTKSELLTLRSKFRPQMFQIKVDQQLKSSPKRGFICWQLS